MSRSATHVLDASALLCLLFSETGADRVAAVVDGAAMSTVNHAETLSKLIERGVEPAEAVTKVDKLPLVLVPLDRDLAEAAARLRPATRAAGLSLGDRCCLALSRIAWVHPRDPASLPHRIWQGCVGEPTKPCLALRHGAVAVTADRAWGRLDPTLRIAVDLVR